MLSLRIHIPLLSPMYRSLRRRRPPRLSHFLLLTCFVVIGLASPTAASWIWPFTPKRFKGSGLLSAGSMGLDGDGRVVAWGDFNGDQFLDVLMLGEDQHTLTVYLWNHEDFNFQRSASFRHPQNVYNVVPGDFTQDGTLDILVMAQGSSFSQLTMSLYKARVGGGFDLDPIQVPSSTLSQPIPLDVDGDMKIDLLGMRSGRPPSLHVWQNVWNASSNSDKLYDIIDPPFNGSAPNCQISNPHSNAVVDLNGDCLADLFLVCDEPDTSKSFQIWVNNKDNGFSFAQSGKLPRGTQSVGFADMDRDGTIDLLITACDAVSPTTGLGSNCAINIAYNKQLPLCSGASDAIISSLERRVVLEDGSQVRMDTRQESETSKRSCRRPDALCVADPNFKFEFQGPNFVTVPMSTLLPASSSSSPLSYLQIFDTSSTPPIPTPPRIGDVNLDGFPDLLFITGARGDRTRKARLVMSEHCGQGKKVGCDVPGARRGWSEVRKGAEALESVGDARGVAFLDMDEDGTLDIMIQRTGDQGQGTILFVQNNFYYDAFFMKAIVLNGACSSGWCTAPNSTEKYHPFGVSYSGATFKYTVLSTSGRRSAAQVAQLPQTAYQALNLPYAFFGLGRTNNYIENFFAGSTKHARQHYVGLEMVIPNSKIVINPPAGDVGPEEWRRELYLRPGEWIPWVGVSVVGAMILLAVVVLVLHLNEKREDEMERRRASHHINFDAL